MTKPDIPQAVADVIERTMLATGATPDLACAHPSVLEGLLGPNWREIATQNGWQCVDGVWTKETP